MNLRELLAEALDPLHEGDVPWTPEGVAIVVSQRLTQPDVLDDFELRVRRRYETHTNEYVETTVSRVLAHMLTETKEGARG